VVAATSRVVARKRVAQTARAGHPRVIAAFGNMAIVSGVERMSFEVLRTLRERGAAVHCIVNSWESSKVVDLVDSVGASWSLGYYWYELRRHARPHQRMLALWDVLRASALTLTGSLGDVMKESARAALSWTRANAKDLGIDPDFYKSAEIHLHVPSGAIPKDGPSAGVTMATALISELTGRPVRGDIAMTGEITLSGKVLPVGGIKEKVLAARRVGIREVILPKQNEKNVNEDLSPELRSELTVHFVTAVEEVLALALTPPVPAAAPAPPPELQVTR